MHKILTYVCVATLTFAGSFLGMKIVHTEEVPPFIAVCDSDDGSGARPCIWVAEYMGDGEGTSFYMDLNGNQHNIPN